MTFSELLFQIWLNKYVIAAVILIVKISLFSTALLQSFEELKEHANSLCEADDKFRQTMASLPENVSNFTNKMVAQAANHAKDAFFRMISDILLIVKAACVFYVDFYLGTYTCLLGAALNGATSFALDSSELVVKAVNTTMVEASNNIEDGLEGLLKIINDILSAAKKVSNFFAPNNENKTSDYVNKVNLSVSSLRDFKISDSVLKDIDNMKSKTPDFSQLSNTSKIIGVPFEKVQDQVGKLKGNDSIKYDSLPVASKSQVASCSSSLNLEKTYREAVHAVLTASIIIMVLISLLAVLATVWLIFCEYKHYKRRMNLVSGLLQEKNFEDGIAINNELNKHSNFVLRSTERLFPALKQKTKDNLYWMISYLSKPYSLHVLLIGLAGLLMVALQYCILTLVKKNINELVHNVEEFSTEELSSLNELISKYVTETNDNITSKQDHINNDLLGNLKEHAVEFNETVDDFLTKVNDTVIEPFHNTPFETPISTVVYCTIGKKLLYVEKGITWFVNRFEISFPTLLNDPLDEFVSKYTGDDNSSNSYLDQIKRAAKNVLKAYQYSLLVELLVSIAFISAWLLEIIIGLILLWYAERSLKEATSIHSISQPFPLSYEQKVEYNYPHTDPFGSNLHTKLHTSSSIYSS